MRKKIKQGQKVGVGFKPRERELVLDHTFAGPELTGALCKTRLVDGRHVVRYTLADLEELLALWPRRRTTQRTRRFRESSTPSTRGSAAKWNHTMMACGN